MWINKRVGYLQDWITQVWVKTTGRKFNPTSSSWLTGPVGDTEIIKDKFIERLYEDGLTELKTEPRGLLNNFSELGLYPEQLAQLHPKVIQFYEQTSRFTFEIWSEWCGIFRPFGWLLAVIFSRRLQQLNLPLSALDSAQGINSEIIKLVDKQTQLPRWTIWYRILKGTQHVIYSGVYTTCSVPNFTPRHLKVLFPLPNGNAIVIMRAEVKDGALLLSSDGKHFGDNGFYFTLTNHRGTYWVKFVRSMHEWITVYVDTEGVLRTNHHLYFFGFPFLKLHYKMEEKQTV